MMKVGRTKDLIEITGGDSTTIGRAIDALGLGPGPGQGASRVFDFRESLQIAVYVQLAKLANVRIARQVALKLQNGLDGLPEDPVAVIGEKGLIAWKSANAEDPVTVEHFKTFDPLAILYRLPVAEVQQIFERVPA